MPNRPLHKLNRNQIKYIHKPGENPIMIFSAFISSFATAKLMALLKEVLEMIVERTDNEIDDEAVDLIFAILSGKADAIVKESQELAAEVAEAVAHEAVARYNERNQ